MLGMEESDLPVPAYGLAYAHLSPHPASWNWCPAVSGITDTTCTAPSGGPSLLQTTLLPLPSPAPWGGLRHEYFAVFEGEGKTEIHCGTRGKALPFFGPQFPLSPSIK